MVTYAISKKAVPGESNRSRLEINFRRLLTRTETMALEVKQSGNENWRLEKFIEALDEMLKELRVGPNEPGKETLKEYTKRVEFLSGVLATTKLDTVEEKAAASQLIHLGVSDSSSLDSTRPMEIKHRYRNKYAEDLRNELLGNSRSGDETDKAEVQDKDLEQVLRYQQRMQEKIADHMLDLTRNLKEQAAMAGEIVRKDTEVLGKSVTQVDVNRDKLQSESEKLEVFNRQACKCWIWFMLVLVCCTFVGMILFMRLFPKRRVLPEVPMSTTEAPYPRDEV